jgi:hypothetical protein
MGSFNVICNLSGLHIERGDKVRAVVCLPSVRSHDTDVSMCYSTDMKFPCLLPVFGEYDDYGGIENVVDDPATILSAAFLDNYLASGQSKYTDNYSAHEHAGQKGMHRWVQLITRHAVELSRYPIYNREKFVGTKLSVAFVLEPAYQNYLKVYDPRDKLRKDLNNWFSWYVAVTKKLFDWINEAPECNDRRSRAYTLERWGSQAAVFANQEADDNSYIPISLPRLKVEGKYGQNALLSYIREGGRYVDEWWFTRVYEEYLKSHVRATKNPLKSVTDSRWTTLRDAFVDMIPLSYMMERLHRTWLSTVTGGQDCDYEFNLAIGKATNAVTSKRLKKWKRENYE